jgi:Spy/CpxP family protein refolding chaperone
MRLFRAKVMRLFKVGLITLVFGVALPGWGQNTAQGAPPTAPGPGARRVGGPVAARHPGMMRAFQRLNLTPDQKDQVRNLMQAQHQKVQSVRQDASLTPEQKQDSIRQLRQSTHQQVLGVLTPEQQAKLNQFQRQRRGLAALNLTSDQRAKIMPIQQQMRQQVVAVRQDASLTPEQKHQKIRDIRQNAMAQMKGVLTPEQQRQLEQMRPRRGQSGPPPAPEGS